MAPGRTTDIIDLSLDDDDDEHTGNAQSAPDPRRLAPRKSGNLQRAGPKRPVIDLTEDDTPNNNVPDSSRRPRARSPPAARKSTPSIPYVQSLLGSQSSRTRNSPQRAKAPSPVVPSSASEDELPDDPVPSSSLPSRRVSRPTSKVLDSLPGSSRRPNQLSSSPNKRSRDAGEDAPRPSPSDKRRRVEVTVPIPSGEASSSRNGGPRASSSQVSKSNSIVVPERARDSPAETTPKAHSPKKSTKRASKDTISRGSSESRGTPLRSDRARDLGKDEDCTQAGSETPRNEPLATKAKSDAPNSVAASDPIGVLKNQSTGHSISKPSTPLRKVSNAGSGSAGVSPSSQLQREAAEDAQHIHDGVKSSLGIVEEDQTPLEKLPTDHEDVEQPSHSHSKSPKASSLALESNVPTEQPSGQIENAALPDWSIFPVEIQVERILGKYCQEMREDTNYLTKASLKQSRLSIGLHRPRRDEIAPSSTRSNQPSVASAVFARLRKNSITQATTASAKIGDGNMKCNVDVHSGAGKPTRIHLKVKTRICDTSSVANDVPEYAHYVSLKSNILAPNSTTMTVWPYFGDGEPDPEEFESYYHMDTDQRHRKIRRLLEAQRIEEYIESVLQDLRVSWDDVLRFLLEPNPQVGTNAKAQAAVKNRHAALEDFPRVAGSKKWKRVLASLSSSSSESMAKAAILCDHFQIMTKFPLWHVARRSATVKQAFSVDERPASSVESRVCRICYLFNCHKHGELRENHSDSDSGVETDEAVAKDILYPPRVNFRKRMSLSQSSVLPGLDHNKAPSGSSKAKRIPKFWETAEFRKPGDWPPFYPCTHPGISCEKARCSCVLQKRPCEKPCGCAPECPRKFQGCSCSSKKNRKAGDFACLRDDRCACYMMGRECDPDLCGACGVCEVLDPVHRHDLLETESKRLCHNASLQRAVPKHTLLGDSGVHGMGLYAGERIEEHEFVGEYKGEIITKEEADRRGAVYEKQHSTYLFSLNTEQEVDSNFYGNKIRFINHRNESGANVYPLIVLVNTVHRIGLFAKAAIKSGEELFFDYGPKFPEHLLGGKQTVTSKSAPHVRNADALNDFYEVEDEEDEAGNRRAKKSTAGKNRGRPRKAEPIVKPIKPKKKMGGARPGAGRKPGKKKAVAEKAPETTADAKVADSDEDEDPRITSQNRFEAYYVSQDKDLSQRGTAEDGDDEDFVDADESEQESSEESEDDEYEGRRRTRGRPRKYEM